LRINSIKALKKQEVTHIHTHRPSHDFQGEHGLTNCLSESYCEILFGRMLFPASSQEESMTLGQGLLWQWTMFCQE